MDHAVWNTLHDGAVEAIIGTVPGDVDVKIGISYLCAKLPTESDYIIVHLNACTLFSFEPFEGQAISDLTAIASRDVEVLSAESAGDIVTIRCTDGYLKLSYKDARTRTGEGLAVSQSDLEAAADRYWTEWTESAKRARG